MPVLYIHAARTLKFCPSIRAVWEMWCCEPAFHNVSLAELAQRVGLQGERPPVPADMPPAYAELMQRCWAQEPFNRPTCDEIVRDLKKILAAAAAEVSAKTKIAATDSFLSVLKMRSTSMPAD
jgi:hypothetical protein